MLYKWLRICADFFLTLNCLILRVSTRRDRLTFGSDSLDKSQDLQVMGTGFAGGTAVPMRRWKNLFT